MEEQKFYNITYKRKECIVPACLNFRDQLKCICLQTGYTTINPDRIIMHNIKTYKISKQLNNVLEDYKNNFYIVGEC